MKTSDNQIFIVEDDAFYTEIIKNTLFNDGYKRISVFDNAAECISNLDRSPDVIILDHMLGQTSGLHVLKKIKEWDPLTQVIFISAQDDMEVVVKALKFGALDYIEKTDQLAMIRLKVIVNRALEIRSVLKRNNRTEALKDWFLVK